MKKGLLIAMALLVTVACSSEGFNSDDYEKVSEYSLEIIRSVELAVHDVDNWLNDDTEERFNSMIESAEEIAKANDELWPFYGDDLTLEDISEWGTIEMSLDGDEWEVEGKDLAESLSDVENDSGYLAFIIEEMENEGIDKLQDAKISASKSMSELRKLLTNK